MTVVPPQTNMVFVDLAPDRVAGVAERLRARGVLVTGAQRLRLVTHLDLDADAIDHAILALRESL